MGARIQYLNISFYFRKFTILGVLRKLCVELYHLGPHVVHEIPISDHVQGEKCQCKSGEMFKKGKNKVHLVVK